MQPNKALREAIKVTVNGAATILLTTFTSCALAVAIERAAHRTLYRSFPHWYKDVKHANGLPHLQYLNTDRPESSSETIQNWEDQGEELRKRVITMRNPQPKMEASTSTFNKNLH